MPAADSLHQQPPHTTKVRLRDPDLLLEFMRGTGGLADRQSVRHRFTRGALNAVLERRLVLPLGRSRLALPDVAADVIAAHRVGAVLSHRSAAAWWGWGVLVAPDLPEVALPRGRHLRVGKPRCDVRWLVLGDGEVLDGATAPLRTVLDCAAQLPFVEALAIADAALRSGLVGEEELRRAAESSRGPGSRARRRVAAAADPRAESVLESAARAVLSDVAGLRLDLQVQICGVPLSGASAFSARVDLADQALQLVIEADSFTYHGGQKVSPEIRTAMTNSSRGGGRCCGSRTSRSCTSRTGCVRWSFTR